MMKQILVKVCVFAVLAIFVACGSPGNFSSNSSGEGTADLVILGGRVMDPETGLDATRNVSVAGGKIVGVLSLIHI